MFYQTATKQQHELDVELYTTCFIHSISRLNDVHFEVFEIRSFLSAECENICALMTVHAAYMVWLNDKITHYVIYWFPRV